MLEKYLTQEKILIEIKVSDWRELIGVVGNILVQTGDIESRYIDAMIKVIEDLGPYAVIAPGVVLLHARPEDGVKRVCIAMATLAQGINFGSVNDPVRLAIALGAVDHDSHIEILRSLANFLEDKDRLKCLYSVKDAEEFIKVVAN